MIPSIRQRAFTALLLAGIAPLAVILLVTHTVTSQALRESENGRVVDLGDEVAREVAYVIDKAIRDLDSLAQSRTLLSAESSKEDKRMEFDRLTESYSHFRDIRLFDLDGWEISTRETDRRRDETRYFANAVKGNRFISRPHPDGLGKEKGYKLLITTYIPIGRPGELPASVVRAEIGLDDIWEILNSAKIGGQPGAFILMDENRKILSHPNEEMISQDFVVAKSTTENWMSTSIGSHTDQQGNVFLHYTKVLNPSATGLPYPLLLLCRQNEETISGMIRQFQITQLAGGGAISILMALFGWFLASKLAQPVIRAAEIAKSVASGSLDARMDDDGPSEMRALATSFNQMVHELKGHRTHLESLVQSRTQRLRESQADLEDLTAQLRATYESTPEAIIVVRPTGEVLAANKRVRDFFGVNGARLLEEGLADGTPSKSALLRCFEDEEKFEEVWKQHTASSGLVHKGEWVVNGEAEMRLAIYSAPVMNSTGNTFARLWMFRDMTEQRRLEQGLQQSTKMEAIGRLSGGVAHDFNNLLTGIIGNLSLSELLGDMPKENEDLVLSAKRAAERAAGIVKQLLTFSRQNKVSLQPWSANRLVKDVQEILTPGLDPSIRLRVNLDDAEPFIFADGNQIDQVLMNFCVNARDALVGGGSITVTTAKAYVNLDALPRQTDCKPGDYVKISVQDDGTGMDESIREKIFEPFFTTKEQGKGTGLGLATSYGIVQEHHGWIECDSELGVGTTFSVYIPACDKPAEVAATASAPVVGGTETILIVDDEQIVRTVAENVLKRQGYKVETAQDGKEALEVVARCGKSISLIMLDLTMPRMSGRETFKELRSGRFPHIPVVICSGYLVEVDSFAEEAGSVPEGVVQKPYQVDVLAREIRRVIDGVDANLV
ncbi:MAG: response regulator [Verrucomicrobiae bacterium]|nr:response regulator [Verrucomicrobiae bacterium]